MKKYLLIKLVFADEMHSDLHDINLGLYEKLSQDIDKYAESLGAIALLESVYNYLPMINRSYACIEYNFDLSDDEKTRIVKYLKGYFDDWYYEDGGMNTYNTLSVVRFLKVDGEVMNV